MNSPSQFNTSAGSSSTIDSQRGSAALTASLDQRVRQMVALHFDPTSGSVFWVDRARRLGLDPIADLRCLADLNRLGNLDPADLQQRPLWDYIPRRFHSERDRFIVAQTGGTTGTGTWTAYREDELEAAFVRPFVAAAMHVRFPAGGRWLFLGPTGPHIIGQAACRIARAMGAASPFMIDLDPRWVRKLPDGSFGRKRYMEHLLDQAMAVINSQGIDVLFATPPMLTALADRMTPGQRHAIRGVHYGGMRIERSFLNLCQRELFPYAVHLSGYGNTLMGCCLELSAAADRTPTYFPHGQRLVLDVIDEANMPVPAGQSGRVRLTRLDESMLIVNLLERDLASLTPPPAHAPTGFMMAGLCDPQPLTTENSTTAPQVVAGLY